MGLPNVAVDRYFIWDFKSNPHAEYSFNLYTLGVKKENDPNKKMNGHNL